MNKFGFFFSFKKPFKNFIGIMGKKKILEFWKYDRMDYVGCTFRMENC